MIRFCGYSRCDRTIADPARDCLQWLPPLLPLARSRPLPACGQSLQHSIHDWIRRESDTLPTASSFQELECRMSEDAVHIHLHKKSLLRMDESPLVASNHWMWVISIPVTNPLSQLSSFHLFPCTPLESWEFLSFYFINCLDSLFLMIWSKEALEREIHFGLIIGFSPSLYSPEETIAQNGVWKSKSHKQI